MFENKSIIIGVSGGIAAYKTAYLVSALSKTEADVNVIMTDNACEFISPLVFETLTGNKCYVDTFDRNFKFDVEHISLAKKADIFMIAPATANVIAKIANGIADDMLTTTFLASKCKKIVSPAMNTAMFENQITQDNIAKLKKYGIGVVEPQNGLLACGDTGAGKMPEPDFLFDVIEREIAREKDMLGKKVLVTAGATMESLDPVRFLTNHSSGKMGFAIAKEAMLRGAEVTVVKANTTAAIPNFVKIVEVSSAKDMFDAVTALSDQQDIIVKAAAVADYTPESYVDSKIKKKDGDLSIPLKRTMDILKYLGENKKEGQFLCGFSMETDNMLENSKAKLSKKNADMIVANNLRDAGSGFKTDTNAVTLITRDGHRSLELKSKAEVAKEIFDEILGLI
ncbi:MAG: bifunctional phosphopantothenoylcysteine decarboxylase/phosphopantothenate--cysteine ligase CoaBC [[Eubacterium] sulci]|nr:bifunctional phosphopantothenoylcysteine decarboxylase/phosphopantothenate--cysteine ligase CoaBC [[Eubacterium] sulci]MBF1147548.1 bifunctional phosphopantothenoylcysteine decarboxylase/phosphopantothenate--cysteine ligase CoaBC [[Eubacterium] sulci]MBF1176294.1 bifunctional phosphopantothenoylcysteine decarboxylase/phosphopantothenate--cysteine ligase CoaBC [[Eubacterium] sulci]MBF1189916.1 bifunctional phosphopantothenoylcysteine decarboxylase/phosphopantothenate--cysteine ligase CoaBC [[E